MVARRKTLCMVWNGDQLATMELAPATHLSGFLGGIRCYIYNCVYYYAARVNYVTESSFIHLMQSSMLTYMLVTLHAERTDSQCVTVSDMETHTCSNAEIGAGCAILFHSLSKYLIG